LDEVRPLTGVIPDWAAGYNLPDSAEVQRLNDLTLISAAVSGGSFALCIIILIFMRARAYG
jgi:hypothetical protein